MAAPDSYVMDRARSGYIRCVDDIDIRIAAGLALGHSYRKIASDTGMSKSAVGQRAKRPDVIRRLEGERGLEGFSDTDFRLTLASVRPRSTVVIVEPNAVTQREKVFVA